MAKRRLRKRAALVKRRQGQPVRSRRTVAGRRAHVATPSSLVRDSKRRALDALALMRRGRSLRKAAKQAHTTPQTVKKYVGPSLLRTPIGRFTPARHDQLSRMLRFPTPQGPIALTIRRSGTAARIARYWSAVDRYLRTGQTDALAEFRGASVQVAGVKHPFVTEPDVLDRLANAGEVTFEDLYVLTA